MSIKPAYRGEVLVVSPHPDDEIIGAGATLLKLRDAGFHIIDLAVTLGRPEHHERRRAELETACDKARFELVIAEELAHVSSRDNLEPVQAHLADLISKLLKERSPAAVVSPSPHDNHPVHEASARAVRQSLSTSKRSVPWLMDSLWGDLPYPTIYSPFDETTLGAVIEVLEAHEGENSRNDYRKLVRHRAGKNAVLGSELVFGSGHSAIPDQPFAELLTEVFYTPGGKWIAGERRVMDFDNPFSKPSGKDLTTWVNSPSWYQIIRDNNP